MKKDIDMLYNAKSALKTALDNDEVPIKFIESYIIIIKQLDTLILMIETDDKLQEHLLNVAGDFIV